MYFRTIKFQRVQDGQWENGYYLGREEHCEENILVDLNFNPIFELWDCVNDYTRDLVISIPEPEET